MEKPYSMTELLADIISSSDSILCSTVTAQSIFSELGAYLYHCWDLFVGEYVAIVLLFITERTFQVSYGTGWGKWEKWRGHNSHRSKCKNGYWIEQFSIECWK